MSLKALTSRAKQAIATKKRIIDCGKRIIRQQGFDCASVEQISKSAGITVGTFYHYFKSKDDLLFEMIPKVNDYFESAETKNLAIISSYDKIVDYFSYLSKYTYQKYNEIVKHILISDSALALIDQDRIKPVIDIIISGQNAGEFSKDYEAKYIAEILFYSVRGIYYHWSRDVNSYNLYDTVREVVERLTFTFLTEEGKTYILSKKEL